MAKTKLKMSMAELPRLSLAADINDVKIGEATKYSEDIVIVPVSFKSPEQLFRVGRDFEKVAATVVTAQLPAKPVEKSGKAKAK